MPELFGGHGRREGGAPSPASCRPQAWSTAVAVAILAALVGRRPDEPGGTVAISPLGGPVRAVSGMRLAGERFSLELGADAPGSASARRVSGS